MTKKHRVFAYGTLMPKDKSGKFLEPASFILGYDMYNYHDHYPYIVKSDDEGAMVVGHLLEVDDETLAFMDKYEGVDRGLYTREEVEVYNIEDGEAAQEMAYVYVSAGVLPQRVLSGDWTRKGE